MEHPVSVPLLLSATLLRLSEVIRVVFWFHYDDPATVALNVPDIVVSEPPVKLRSLGKVPFKNG